MHRRTSIVLFNKFIKDIIQNKLQFLKKSKEDVLEIYLDDIKYKKLILE